MSSPFGGTSIVPINIIAFKATGGSSNVTSKHGPVTTTTRASTTTPGTSSNWLFLLVPLIKFLVCLKNTTQTTTSPPTSNDRNLFDAFHMAMLNRKKSKNTTNAEKMAQDDLLKYLLDPKCIL
ncbi:hypothetical protein BDA99DRAFT_554999 [Phascolomyces articulosus]|uniref:Uncharacterized protein n=1 Tax=Phascolomyces articulosus TaxID=60185 RepID=A0AAD5KAX2_9FUNG|nr:hypothetical protein BDA99DRAFT_554999 [Phascolomyces articulosus]